MSRAIKSLSHTQKSERNKILIRYTSAFIMADHHEVEKGVVRDASPNLQESPDHHDMSIREYCTTRLSSLKPPMHSVENPFKLLAMLNARQWSFFAIAFFAWSWDAFDCKSIPFP